MMAQNTRFCVCVVQADRAKGNAPLVESNQSLV
jgi:hypothetical protein